MPIRRQHSANVTPKDGILIRENKANKTVVFKKAMPIIEEALYKAKVISTEIVDPRMTKLGLTDRVRVGFTLEDGREIHSNFLLICHKNQPVYQLIMSVMGTVEDVNLDELIGAEVGIEIKHNETREGTFANVVSVLNVGELEDDGDYSESDNLEVYEDNEEYSQNAYDEIDS